MIVKDVIAPLDLTILAGEAGVERAVTSGYVGDLLSCVMAHAASESVWVTVQAHPNVIAVASLVGASAVVVTEGVKVEPAALEKANREGIPVLASHRSSYEIVAGLTRLGVRAKPC